MADMANLHLSRGYEAVTETPSSCPQLPSSVLFMTRAKRHHYVPAAYLARFGENEYVRVRRRGVPNMYKPHVKNVAVESGFYEVTGPDGEPSDEVERELSGLEGDAISALTEIDRTEQPPAPGSKDQCTLATFLAVQYTRTPKHREQIMFPERVAEYAGDRQIDAALMAEYLEQVHLGIKPQDSEVNGALDFVQVALQDRSFFTKDNAIQLAVSNIEMLSGMLRQMCWSLEGSRAPRFITSDAPLVLWRKPRVEDQHKGFGLLDAEEVRFPISPSMQLVLSPEVRKPQAWVHPNRTTACNAEVALTCYRVIIGHPRHDKRLRFLELPERRAVLRFNKGPMYQEKPDGSREYMGDVLHQWVPRR